MKKLTDEGDEYEDPDMIPLRPDELAEIEDALKLVQQSEAHLSWPKGYHYNLQMVLRKILGIQTNKETMKDVARRALDNGYKTKR
jgi:hypothetical protein